MTVSVLSAGGPAAVELDPSDLRIQTFRASGAGGQNVQKVETAVRIAHLPSGLTVAVQDERHQEQNRRKALDILAERLRQRAQDRHAAKVGAKRRADHGSGHFAERRRSYLFRERTVVDHRTGRRAPLDKVLAGRFDLLDG